MQVWGELQPHDKKELHVPGHPDMYLRLERADRAGQALHLRRDVSHRPLEPPGAAEGDDPLPVRCRAGGDTQYVNMHLAYDELPEAMKQRIDGLKAVHVY